MKVVVEKWLTLFQISELIFLKQSILKHFAIIYVHTYFHFISSQEF